MEFSFGRFHDQVDVKWITRPPYGQPPPTFLSDGQRLATHTVIWFSGICPNSDNAHSYHHIWTGKRFMFHRPSLRVGRKALNFRNLEKQGRKKKILNFLKISKNYNCNSNFQGVTIPFF
jgi:hypothetical protein